MGDVSARFLDPLMRHFTMPKSADGKEDSWEADYHEALGFYSDRVLEFAAKKLIFSDRSTKSFPLPAECLKACKEVHNDFSKPAPKTLRRDEWSPESIKDADRLIKSQMGRKAAEEGWVWQLWDWIRKNGRLPDIHEARKVAEHSAATNAATTDFLASEEAVGRLIGPATKKLLGQMSSRRKSLKEMAFSE